MERTEFLSFHNSPGKFAVVVGLALKAMVALVEGRHPHYPSIPLPICRLFAVALSFLHRVDGKEGKSPAAPREETKRITVHE